MEQINSKVTIACKYVQSIRAHTILTMLVLNLVPLPPFKSFDMGLNIVGFKKSQIIKSDMGFFRYYIQLSLFV